jgi:hypothetical protein
MKVGFGSMRIGDEVRPESLINFLGNIGKRWRKIRSDGD